MLVRRIACSRLSPTRQPYFFDRAKVFSRQTPQCLVDSERCIGCVLLSTASGLAQVSKMGDGKPAQLLSSRGQVSTHLHLAEEAQLHCDQIRESYPQIGWRRYVCWEDFAEDQPGGIVLRQHHSPPQSHGQSCSQCEASIPWKPCFRWELPYVLHTCPDVDEAVGGSRLPDSELRKQTLP